MVPGTLEIESEPFSNMNWQTLYTGAGAGGWGAGPGGPPAGGRPGQWPENDSPTMGRRFDDGGTSIWGGKAPAGPMQAGPPGGEYILYTSSFIDHKTVVVREL